MIDQFDESDIKNLGRPKFWSLDAHVHAIKQMIMADELQIALSMIDNIPGWYRDNYPPELRHIKETIYKQTYDQIEYATDNEEAECTREFGEAQWDTAYMFPRAEIISQIVKQHNARGISPWIYDLGCSHGNLPLGLIKTNHAFEYCGVGMNHRIKTKLKEWVGGHWSDMPAYNQPTILYCTEVIEHAFNPHDIVHSSYKPGLEFDQILLSVPMYTLGGGLPNWDTRRLGHVRTWTPSEFREFANKSWPGYKWQLFKSASMVLVGEKSGTSGT